mgnify:FL=1
MAKIISAATEITNRVWRLINILKYMNKFKTPIKVVIFSEKRKRKRIINAKECQKDMDIALQQIFAAFHEAVKSYNFDIKKYNPQDRVRSFEATFFNTYLMKSLRYYFGSNLKKGMYGRMFLYTNGYIVLFKKLKKNNMPMNIKTEHFLKIENQQEGYLFSEEEDCIAPIVFFGYSKSSVGELINPRLVYIDEEKVKWSMDEHDVIPQKEITLFTPLAEVQTVHPKIRVKKREGNNKAI